MRRPRESLKLAAVKLLSWMPYAPCNATLEILALDAFGVLVDRSNRKGIASVIGYIEDQLGVRIESATLCQTGGVGNRVHYWVGQDPANRKRVEGLVRNHLIVELNRN